MTRYERIKNMTPEELAKAIIDNNITDDFCKDDCGNEDCQHDLECCVRWLGEEIEA